MFLSDLSVKQPVFASVMSLLLVLFGLVAFAFAISFLFESLLPG